MNNCIFCKIANGEIKSNVVYEDNDFIAILDLSPATKGHILLIPKTHAANLLELPDAVASKVLPVAKKIINAQKEVLGFTNYNLIQNNGRIAGQTVDHYHLHLIPRYSIDEISLWTPHEDDPSVTKELAEEIRGHIK